METDTAKGRVGMRMRDVFHASSVSVRWVFATGRGRVRDARMVDEGEREGKIIQQRMR